MAYTLYVDQRLSSADICQTLRISQATFNQYVALGRLALFSCIRSLQPQRSSSSLSAVSVSSSSLSASSSASARLNQCSRRRLRTAAAAGRWRAAGRRRRVGGQVARHRVGAHGWRTRLVEKAV